MQSVNLPCYFCRGRGGEEQRPCVIVRVIFKCSGKNCAQRCWGPYPYLGRSCLTEGEQPESVGVPGAERRGKTSCQRALFREKSLHCFSISFGTRAIQGNTFAEHQKPLRPLPMTDHTHTHSCRKACLSCKNLTCAGKHPEASVFLQNAPGGQ